MVHLIASGETSGRLDEALERAARQQQNDIATRLAAFAALFEPAMILFMGGVVLAIVLAILLPIFQLNSAGRENDERKRGFTLIEVLVVVAILGILAAIVVPRIMDRPDEAKRVAAKADIAAIVQALKLYRLDNGFYPATDQGLGALVAAAHDQPGARQLEAGRLSRPPAQGSVGRRLPVPQPRREGRDRRLQPRRRPRARRRRQCGRHRQLGLAGFTLDRGPGGRRDHRHHRRARRP